MLFTYSPKIRRLARRVLPLFYLGHNVECPCCERQFRRFIPRHGVDSLCPGCLALQRHRLLVLYLVRETCVPSGTLAVLHIAPEEGLQEKLTQIAGPDYVTLDASPSATVAVRGDVTALPFSPASFDLIICSHVLEHVPDDARALSELIRVLRPGGSAVLLQPVHDELEATVEDPAITSPAERRRAFGQSDHARIYGRDFPERVRAAGFEVSKLDYLAALDRQTIVMHGLGREFIYVATKPSPCSSAAQP